MSLRFAAALVVSATVAAAQPARAGFVVGTQSFSFPGDKFLDGRSTPDRGDINTATSFRFTLPINAGESRTGDFEARYGNSVVSIGNPSALDLSSIPMFTVGDTSFGTFTAATLVEDLNMSQFTRALTFAGVFDPGTAFPAGQQDNTPALFTLSLTQTGGADTAISASGTLTTAAPTAAVPAPPAAVVALVGVPLLGLLRRVRRPAD